MEKKQIKFEKKKGHKEPIVTINNLIFSSISNPNTFATFSEDKTAIIWDLRTTTNLIITNPALQAANDIGWMAAKGNSLLLSGDGDIYEFDVRKNSEPMSVINVTESGNLTYFEFENFENKLVISDEEGSIYMYKSGPWSFKQNIHHVHSQCITSLITLNRESPKQELQGYSVGLDYNIKKWNIEKGRILKETDTISLFKTPDGKSTIFSLPFLYSVDKSEKRDLLVTATETGHVLGFSDLRNIKLNFMDQIHLGRIVRIFFPNFSISNDLILTISKDLSWGLWKLNKKNSEPLEIIYKIAIPKEPNYIEALENGLILIADTSNDLTLFYTNQPTLFSVIIM